MPVPPLNAYESGTNLVVGSHKVSIIKFIGEGGFAHVYTCTINPPFRGNTTACLKRVQVPSKLQLNLLRQEVDAMKRLKGNRCIVSYIDSHAARLDANGQVGGSNPSSQQYEVFLLMEYCSRNGLIDFMNTRLTHKLQEPEILQIMRDITTGVAMCHHLQPPIIHRDIKIENVLIDQDGTYKLCDFGSAVGYQPVPATPQETINLKNDIMQYTTPQYRAPEMIELSRGFPIDDKSDIWALGCLLYKLCYYTTPFESPNQQSLEDMEKVILHADQTLKLPHDQPGSIFSPRLQNIIKCCLREDPRRRPNAVQLLGEICAMLNAPVPDVIPSSTKHHIKLAEQQSQQQQHNDQVSKLPTKPTLTNSTIANTSNPGTQVKAKASADPFASIDKSKLLSAPKPKQVKSNGGVSATNSPLSPQFPHHPQQQHQNHTFARPKSTYIPKISPPSSRKTSFENYHRYSTSSTSLKEFVQKQVDESSNEVYSMRKSEEDYGRGTLDFLRSKQESQNTGGSVKMSFKNGLKKISTGGLSANGTGGSINSVSSHNYRRSSVTSLKQLLTGGSSRKASVNVEDSNSYAPEANLKSNTADSSPPERKVSIKKRMAILLHNSKGNSSVSKTASGYGKYTDDRKTNPIEDLDAINSPVTPFSSSSSSEDERVVSNRLQVPKSRSSHKIASKPQPPLYPKVLSKPVSTTPSKTNTPSKKHSPVVTKNGKTTSEPKKKPPPKPKKPSYLKSGAGDRRLSNSSDLSIPDIDDLEKEFSKRFPSKVL